MNGSNDRLSGCINSREVLIVVASKNPIKLQAAESGFQSMFPDATFQVSGIESVDGISAQPMTDTETLRGATQRAQYAMSARPRADFWVGIEGGIATVTGEMHSFAWVVILGHGKEGKSKTATFILPQKISELIQKGLELGDADDLVFGLQNSKQANGAIGILTGNVIDRLSLYRQAVIAALIPFKNNELYPSRD